MFIVIIALVAFVIGAGMGVSLSFDDGNDGQPHFENVTEEMTKDVNQSKVIQYDKDIDNVDYNENTSSQITTDYQTTYEENK